MMTDKVLYVDDDPKILAAYQRNLGDRFCLITAEGAREALETIGREGPFAVVVVDMKMPDMDGISFLKEVRRDYPDTTRMMLTGNADQNTAIEAVNQGHVFQFLTKPCSSDMLATALDSGIKQYQLVTAEKELLEDTLNGSINMLTEILSLLQPESFGMAQRLRDYVRAFAEAMEIEQTWDLEVAALLCPIGKMAIPPDVNKRAMEGEALAPAESEMIRRVPELGANLLSNIPRLEEVSDILLYQDKNYDGTGFPDDKRSAGKSIPQGARMIKLFRDILQQEISGLSRIKAVEYVRGRRGSYDPDFLDNIGRWMEVFRQRAPKIELSLKELKPGYTLLKDIETGEGLTLIGAGFKISPLMLQRIRNFAEITEVLEPIEVEGELPDALKRPMFRRHRANRPGATL